MNGLANHFASVERWTLILSALVIAAAFVAMPQPVATAVAVGAGLMSLNAFAIRRIAERTLKSQERTERPGFAILLFNIKLIALIGLVFVALKVLGLDAIGFLLGISVFPVAIVITALVAGARDGSVDASDGGAEPTPPTSGPIGAGPAGE